MDGKGAKTPEKEKALDYYTFEHWQNKNVVAAVLGTIRAFVNYVSSLVGDVAHNIIFARHQHSMSGMYQEGYQRGKKESAAREETSKETAEDRVASLEEKRGAEEPELDPHERDTEACALLSDDVVRQHLEGIGVLAFPERDSDRILLAFRDSDGCRQNFGTMSKTGLIEGKADMLAASLYRQRLTETKDIQAAKLDAALDAVLASAGISIYAYADVFRKADSDGHRADIASVGIEVPGGAAEIRITTDPRRPETAVAVYNGKSLCSCDARSLSDSGVMNRIKEAVRTEYEAETRVRHRIGNKGGKEFQGYEFFTNKQGRTAVNYRDGEQKIPLGTYQFESTKDVKALSDRICSKSLGQVYDVSGNSFVQDFKLGDCFVSGEVLAYSIAAMSNPSMKQEIENGEYLNPVTQQYEPGGAAHISIIHDLYGVSFKQNTPVNGDMEQSLIGEYANLADIGTRELNALVTGIQTAHMENQAQSEIVEDHVRIQDAVNLSPLMEDADARKVLEQNALDERTALFLHETEPPMELEIELDEIPFEPDISDR